MKEIKFLVDSNCKHCKKGLKYFEKLQKRNKNAYMSYIIHPIPKSDKELEKRKIMGLTLIPDYNSEGHLTHFHIEEQKK